MFNFTEFLNTNNLNNYFLVFMTNNHLLWLCHEIETIFWININQEITFLTVLFFCVFLLQERAFEMSQKYKEGKFIIELSHMIKDNGWDWEESLQLSSWLFQKLLPLCLKGFQSSFLIPCTSHRCATLSLFTALPTIAWCLIYMCSFFSSNHNNTCADVSSPIAGCAETRNKWMHELYACVWASGWCSNACTRLWDVEVGFRMKALSESTKF